MEQTPVQKPTRQRNRAAAKNEDAGASPGLAAAEKAPAAAPAVAEAPPPAAKPEPVMERPPMRTDLRETNPQAAAEKRAAELLDHLGTMDEGTDEFKMDKSLIPPGWDYNWKRKYVNGMADPAYDVAVARSGWEPVPASRHPDMMPADWKGNTIERKGQILMERPKQISDLVRQRDDKAARDQVRVKEQQLASAGKDQMPRAGDPDGDPRTRPNIKKSYEPMPIPSK